MSGAGPESHGAVKYTSQVGYPQDETNAASRPSRIDRRWSSRVRLILEPEASPCRIYGPDGALLRVVPMGERLRALTPAEIKAAKRKETGEAEIVPKHGPPMSFAPKRKGPGRDWMA